MPEAPEVRRFADQLREFISQKKLIDIQIHSGRYTKTNPEGLLQFRTKMPIKIETVQNKGKFLYFEMENDWYLWSTLGLTGSWNKAPDEHTRVSFSFNDQESIYFNDIRNFGTLKFVLGKAELQNKLKSLGPDVLVEDVSDAWFRSKIKNRSTKTIAEILMDQSMIAGVGNYIKAEALYLAKISPHRTGGSLTDPEIFALNKAIHSVIRESYKSGGSTFRTYADFEGKVGNFSDRFMVYGQKEDPLGNSVIREETKDKRTTHWVPAIQK